MSESQNELLQDYKDNLLGVFGDPALVLTGRIRPQPSG